jgi:hypothetical protein
MKNIYTFLILVITGIRMIANPITGPVVHISELFFDPVKGWQLELEYINPDQPLSAIDSLYISSKTGRSKVKDFYIIGTKGYIVVTKDSLLKEINIDQNGDSVTLESYLKFMGGPYTIVHNLTFGEYSKSVIGKPKNGQSIARSELDGIFYKDKSPTIGKANDTTGMCGTIKGIIYDRKKQAISDKTFFLMFDFNTNQNGEYEARILSNYYTRNTISNKTGDRYNTVKINPISCLIEPDTVINFDIYLQEDLPESINDLKETGNNPVKLYPNPVCASEKLTIEIDLPVLTSNIWVSIKGIDGKIIKKEKVKNSVSIIDTPGASGTYIISVQLGDHIIYSDRLLVSNE